jgi:hypothetical protein
MPLGQRVSDVDAIRQAARLKRAGGVSCSLTAHCMPPQSPKCMPPAAEDKDALLGAEQDGCRARPVHLGDLGGPDTRAAGQRALLPQPPCMLLRCLGLHSVRAQCSGGDRRSRARLHGRRPTFFLLPPRAPPNQSRVRTRPPSWWRPIAEPCAPQSLAIPRQAER